MAYTALTFVYGEVLTATKMNALAANDESFHDGSGLADNAVTTAKIANGAVKADKIDFSTIQIFSTHMSGTQSLADEGNIAFDIEDVNHGDFVLSDGVITIPVSGTYHIDANIWYRNARCWIKITKNEANIGEVINTTTTFGCLAVSRSVSLTAGDRISIQHAETGTSGLVINGGTNNVQSTNMTIARIG